MIGDYNEEQPLSGNHQPPTVIFELPPELRTLALNFIDSSLQSLNVSRNNTADTVTATTNAEPGTSLDTSTDSIEEILNNEDAGEQGDAFTLFPKLPPELRNNIWKKACFVSRVVDVWCVPVGDTGFGDAFVRPFRQKIWMFKSHSQPPILHASKEARSIGLQYYELSFEAKTAAMIGQVDVEISIPPRVYVHCECDIICPMPIKNIEEFRSRIHDLFVFFLEYFRTSPKIRRLALSTKRAEIGTILFSPPTALEEVLLYHEVPELDRRFGLNDPISLELVQVVEEVEVEQEDSTEERHLRF